MALGAIVVVFRPAFVELQEGEVLVKLAQSSRGVSKERFADLHAEEFPIQAQPKEKAGWLFTGICGGVAVDAIFAVDFHCRRLWKRRKMVKLE